MRTRKPLDRNNLKINKGWNVLEVGSGHNPSSRSNVIVEKYIDNNGHRCGDVKIYKHQTFINAEGENLPFKDKEFDYVICNQVLEHVDNPVVFIEELIRVSKRGYFETPSLIGEFLFPKESHKWAILDIDNKLVFFEKSKMSGNFLNNYGELFLNYLPFQSLPYKFLWLTEGDLMLNRYEWSDDIDFIVNPTDLYYSSFFTKKWTREMVEKVFPKRSLSNELRKIIFSIAHLIKVKVQSKISKHRTITLEEYLRINNTKI